MLVSNTVRPLIYLLALTVLEISYLVFVTSVDPDQTAHSAPSDQGSHSSLLINRVLVYKINKTKL